MTIWNVGQEVGIWVGFVGGSGIWCKAVVKTCGVSWKEQIGENHVWNLEGGLEFMVDVL